MKISDINPEQDYTFAEVQQMFGVSQTALNSAMSKGRIKAVKLFGRWRVSGSSLMEYITVGDGITKHKTV